MRDVIELTVDEMLNISGGGISLGFEFTDFSPDHILAVGEVMDVPKRAYGIMGRLLDVLVRP